MSILSTHSDQNPSASPQNHSQGLNIPNSFALPVIVFDVLLTERMIDRYEFILLLIIIQGTTGQGKKTCGFRTSALFRRSGFGTRNIFDRELRSLQEKGFVFRQKPSEESPWRDFHEYGLGEKFWEIYHQHAAQH